MYQHQQPWQARRACQTMYERPAAAASDSTRSSNMLSSARTLDMLCCAIHCLIAGLPCAAQGMSLCRTQHHVQQVAAVCRHLMECVSSACQALEAPHLTSVMQTP